MRTEFDFSGQNVVVTGANRGLGYAIGYGFAKAGAHVEMIALEESIYDAATVVNAECIGSARGFACDITDRGAVRNTFSQIGSIDVLINNAGLELITPIESVDEDAEERFCRIVDINVNGTYYVTREAVKKMSHGSRIVITASIWSKTAVAGFGAYCATKHANLGFTRSIAQELGPKEINVNAVCPGFIKTEASMRSINAESKRSGRTQEEVIAELLDDQALAGLLDPEDVVSTYMFLASDLAANITGQSLHIDRGAVMD